MKTKELDIAFQELNLNIKYQKINSKEFTKIGYMFEEGKYVFLLILPFNLKYDENKDIMILCRTCHRKLHRKY